MPFQTFSATHGLTVIIIAVIIGLCLRIVRRDPQGRHAQMIIKGHIAALLLAFPLSAIAWSNFSPAFSLDNLIPLHLCNIAAIAGALALYRRHPLACEITWFWGLAGTMQGLITPALPYDFPHPVFFSFFLLHGIVVSTALLLACGLRWRPRLPLRTTVVRMFIAVNIYLVIALIANALFQTNFGFASGKPDQASILDIMPDWPWYLFILEGIALVAFALLALPFRDDPT